MTRSKAIDMMMQYLGAGPGDVQTNMDDTGGCHSRFGFVERLYRYRLDAAIGADGDDAKVV